MRHPFEFGVSSIRDETLAPDLRPKLEIRRHIAEYYAMITHLDDAIGRIIRSVDKRGLLDRTIFILAGDNGLAVGRHGLMGKQNHYEHSIRVPLIFSGPNIPQGQVSDSYVYLFDIFPTLCDLLAVATPPTVDGKSVMQCFADPNFSIRETLFFAYTDLIRSVKDERYKLCVYSYGDTNRLQLFDLIEDPHELSSIATLPSQSSRLKKLFDELIRMSREWDDQSSRWGETFWERFRENGGFEGAVRV